MTWKEEWLASLNTVWAEPKRKPKRKPIEKWINVSKASAYEITWDIACVKEQIRLIEVTEAKEIWRLLEVGEIVQAGDEYQVGLLTWQPTGVPGTVAHHHGYRRRVKVCEVR